MTLRTGTETRILDAAEELFFTRGVAATPIDAVIERAGVSAATLYRGWSSKELLVAAALGRRQLAWVETWDRVVARHDGDEDRLLAVFDALDEFRRGERGARWCAFLGSSAEYLDPPAEVAAAVAEDTATLRRRLTELARAIVGDQADSLAERLLLVVTGDLAMRLRGIDAGRTARAVGEVLVAEARGA